MKRKLFAIFVATMLAITTFTGCGNTSKGSTESVTETATETVKDITTYVKGIKDLKVELNAKDVDYLKNVTYDEKYIKTVTADSSKVNVTKVGKYDLVYTITPVDTDTKIATVTKTVTVEVVITDNSETKKASDGTTPVDKSSDTVTSDNTKTTEKPSSTASSETSSSNSEPATQAPVDNTPTEPATPAHTHNWIEVTENVTVTDSPATTRQEVVTEAWDETVVDVPESYETITEFLYDGYRPTSMEDSRAYQRALAEAGCPSNIHHVFVTTPAVTHTVHHDAVYKTVDVPAVTHTETRVIGYKCDCGATK